MALKKFYCLFSGAVLSSILLWATPSRADYPFREILKTTAQSRLQFSPYTVGAVISGGGDRLYVLQAQKGQYLRVTVHSTGARAFVVVFDSKGKDLATLTDQSQPFEYEIPKIGDYYILCYSGPTIHFYDLTVRVD
jgi:hypothetical protein